VWARRGRSPPERAGASDLFGELGLLRGGERAASVVAATDMRVRVIPQPKFAPALQTLPTLARSVRDAASVRLLALPSHGTDSRPAGLALT
jgi:CRP-like cAMP-binding protein